MTKSSVGMLAVNADMSSLVSVGGSVSLAGLVWLTRPGPFIKSVVLPANAEREIR